ncbi:MAG: hypothetical protein WDZ59_01150 [Pirellulales bacterium]
MDAKNHVDVSRQLGSPTEIAATAVSAYRHGRFSRRHPWLTFLAFPIVALLLGWIGLITVILVAIDRSEANVASWQLADPVVPYFVAAAMLVPIALTSIFFCRLARRAGVGWNWTLATCGVIAVLGGAAISQLALPTESTPGVLSFGLGLSMKPSLLQCLQFSIPLSIGGWALWRDAENRKATLSYRRGRAD